MNGYTNGISLESELSPDAGFDAAEVMGAAESMGMPGAMASAMPGSMDPSDACQIAGAGLEVACPDTAVTHGYLGMGLRKGRELVVWAKDNPVRAGVTGLAIYGGLRVVRGLFGK